jgi:hypothetical protein
MADDPKARPAHVDMSVIDAPHAPFIFYEHAPSLGHTNGVINITLSAQRVCNGPDGKPVTDQVVVAYLRGNIQAATHLRKALDDALLLAAPTKGEGKAN